MRLLIDTCVLIWASTDTEGLSRRAAHLIEDNSNDLLVSVVSAWEIGIKQSTGRLFLMDPTARFMEAAAETLNFSVLPVQLPHALAAGTLPFHHRDPFDRMLIAQAMVERVPILSPDHVFAAYPVEVIW